MDAAFLVVGHSDTMRTFMVELTPQQKAQFLRKLKVTHGNVSKAAQAIQIGRSTAYQHKAKDADFSEAWDEILASVYDEMEQELYRRAVAGWKDGSDSKIKKKSDRLLEFALKGNRAEKFRERLDINNHHSGNLDVNLQATIDSVYGDPNNAQIQPGDPGDDPDSES